MDRERITRADFPVAEDGYDRPSVDAHLAAVAALNGALEAQIAALEVERDALRRQIRATGENGATVARAESEKPAIAGSGGAEAPEPAEASESRIASDGSQASEAVGSEATAEPTRQSESSEQEVSARLVAAKMAVDGAGREAIRERLIDEYRLEDVDSLIDDVLERIA